MTPMTTKFLMRTTVMNVTKMKMLLRTMVPENDDSETDGHGHSYVHPHHTVDVSGAEGSVHTSSSFSIYFMCFSISRYISRYIN